MSPKFKKYLLRQMTDKGAVLVSEIEIAEGTSTG